MSENSAVFCESGSSCPSQNAQPLGAKLNAKIRISATNGFMTFLRLRRINAEQRDDETHREERLEVVVRLAAARGREARHLLQRGGPRRVDRRRRRISVILV